MIYGRRFSVNVLRLSHGRRRLPAWTARMTDRMMPIAIATRSRDPGDAEMSVGDVLR